MEDYLQGAHTKRQLYYLGIHKMCEQVGGKERLYEIIKQSLPKGKSADMQGYAMRDAVWEAERMYRKKSSDKYKWFATDKGEKIYCTMDDLTDLLTILFKGDWVRAKRTAPEFHEVKDVEL